MKFDSFNYNKYPSRRQVVYGNKGMVATTQPLAAQAGLDMLKQGGNAIDAAIATAACLTVVEPTSNGIGGDAFALVWTGGKLHGLNSSGQAPKGISIDELREKGFREMPKHGWYPVTVPGIPKAWAELSKKFGRLSLKQVIKPAIEYARNGFPVSPVVARCWLEAYRDYRENLQGGEFENWFKTFAPKGRAPRSGEIWNSPEHASTLEKIAETYSDAFYRGELAEKIDKFSREYGGYLRKEDLDVFEPKWVKPIGVNYKGFDIWEIPPNGQGMVALLTLNILKGFELNGKEDVETYHKQLEAIKLAFADGKKYITDIDEMAIEPQSFLSDEYAEERRRLITDNATMPIAGRPQGGGTVYLSAVDCDGNMVSYIQSNYRGFGSGLVVPGTGIALQNRGADFSLKVEDANCLKPGKRSYHTIIPGFITKGNQAVGPFGVMGAYMQPQGHVQAVMNMIDFNLNPQEALDAPRWQWVGDNTVFVESHFPKNIATKLWDKGHDIRIQLDNTSFGRGQIILRNDEGVFVGGTESRADSSIAVW